MFIYHCSEHSPIFPRKDRCNYGFVVVKVPTSNPLTDSWEDRPYWTVSDVPPSSEQPPKKRSKSVVLKKKDGSKIRVNRGGE